MGNMPVLKDLIVDMDAVHWKKIQRVTPWLLAKQPVPEREYLVPTKRRWSTSRRRWPASSAAPASRTAWRWRSTPASSAPRRWPRPTASSATRATTEQFERLNDLAQDPQGIFDCTHCFKCVEACPKDVNPMGQIMRLRRIATQRPPHRRPEQRRAPRGGVHDADQATTACCGRPSCCPAPTAATRGSASSLRPPAKELLELAAVDRQGADARQGQRRCSR